MKKLTFFILAILIVGCGNQTTPKIPDNNEIRERITVGVLYFDNTSKSKEYEALSAGLVDMFITELDKSVELQVIERERLDKLMKELKMDGSMMVDQSTAQKIGKLLGAQALYYGGYMVMMGQLQLNAHLFRVETGELMASSGGNCEDASDLKKIREQVGEISDDVRSQIKDNYKSLLADIYYSRGRDYEKIGNSQKALSAYQKALELQSDHRLTKKAMKQLAENSAK